MNNLALKRYILKNLEINCVRKEETPKYFIFIEEFACIEHELK